MNSTVPIVLHGRNNHHDTAVTRIIIRSATTEPDIVIEGADIESPTGGVAVSISAKFPTAVDDQHDASYVAVFTGGGLQFRWMQGTVTCFRCYLFEASWDDTPETHMTAVDCTACGQRHPTIVPFHPPRQPWRPGVYDIVVETRPTP